MKNFIDEKKIFDALEHKASKDEVFNILKKCQDTEHKGLSIKETAVLLNVEDKEIVAEIFKTAKKVKEFVYGDRMVFFAPLYVNNLCDNSCLYCGFKKDNKNLQRTHLNHHKIKEEVSLIINQGHKRILMVYGESEKYGVENIVEDIKAAYSVKGLNSGEIRRINVNIAPLSVEGFKVLKTAEIGTFQCFQETYHQETYKNVHVSGKKSDFLWRLYAHHRAIEAGIEDVGIGVLLGLYNPKFDILAMIEHANVLEKECGVGPHTISFPRIEPALDCEMAYNPPFAVDDFEFKKIVAITRLALPYVGMIISTRESACLRDELLELGISQLSAGSKVSPGGYKVSLKQDTFNQQQFKLSDERSLDEVIYDLATKGYMPSFCTGCYRKHRVGEHFMGLAKKCFIKDYCTPNAIWTFAEYLRDYASDKTKKAGWSLIESKLATIVDNDNIKKRLSLIANGENDVYQ